MFDACPYVAPFVALDFIYLSLDNYNDHSHAWNHCAFLIHVSMIFGIRIDHSYIQHIPGTQKPYASLMLGSRPFYITLVTILFKTLVFRSLMFH